MLPSAPPLHPAETVSPAVLHALFGAAYADYLIGPPTFPLGEWPHFLARQGIALALSRVAGPAEAPVAFAYVANRPALQRWRLASLAALPAARGQGAAPTLLADFRARAQAAGMAAVELEVFAQNTRAFELYQRHGYEVLDALHGHSGSLPTDIPTSAGPAPTVVDRDSACAWLDAAEAAGVALPLQVSAAVLRALPDPGLAWQHGRAQLCFARPAGEPLFIRSLVDHDPAQADATRLLQALAAAYPGQAVTVPALQRPTLGGEALVRLGLARQPLHQWWMRSAL
jgi:ribosomal protein S18 acetylase RimI-like enzyme